MGTNRRWSCLEDDLSKSSDLSKSRIRLSEGIDKVPPTPPPTATFCIVTTGGFRRGRKGVERQDWWSRHGNLTGKWPNRKLYIDC